EGRHVARAALLERAEAVAVPGLRHRRSMGIARLHQRADGVTGAGLREAGAVGSRRPRPVGACLADAADAVAVARLLDDGEDVAPRRHAAGARADAGLRHLPDAVAVRALGDAGRVA